MKLREPDTAGACVTIPHKEAVIPLLDELSPHAQAIGAVNAVTCAQGIPVIPFVLSFCVLISARQTAGR